MESVCIMKCKICSNKIEGIQFEVYTNNNENMFQEIRLSKKDKRLSKNIISPIDFYTVITGIMVNDKLDNLKRDLKGVWGYKNLVSLIDEVKN